MGNASTKSKLHGDAYSICPIPSQEPSCVKIRKKLDDKVENRSYWGKLFLKALKRCDILQLLCKVIGDLRIPIVSNSILACSFYGMNLL
jgi:hypothetical protein